MSPRASFARSVGQTWGGGAVASMHHCPPGAAARLGLSHRQVLGGTSSWQPGRALHVGMGDRQERDEAEDERREREGHIPVSPAETTDTSWLAHVVGEGGSEGTGDDVGEPEREDRVPGKSAKYPTAGRGSARRT